MQCVHVETNVYKRTARTELLLFFHVSLFCAVTELQKNKLPRKNISRQAEWFH